MKYKEVIILEKYGAAEIQKQINYNISKGFELFNFGSNDLKYYAAMGKKENTDPMDTGPK